MMHHTYQEFASYDVFDGDAEGAIDGIADSTEDMPDTAWLPSEYSNSFGCSETHPATVKKSYS